MKDLLINALKMNEDIYLSQIAAERDTSDQKIISHEEAWK